MREDLIRRALLFRSQSENDRTPPPRTFARHPYHGHVAGCRAPHSRGDGTLSYDRDTTMTSW